MASYEGELSTQELYKLFFYKKVCPDCRRKLIRNKDKTFLRRGWHRITDVWTYGDQYHLKYYYYCMNCSKRYKDYSSLAGSYAVVHFDSKYLICFNTLRKQWEVPAGGREEGETAKDCAIRELFEEN